jgi:glutamyl-tRNA synthetase
MIKTRFAPSPTGELHLGGARTALFAYLYAKNQGGEFYLRIEDTDRDRLVSGSIERIIESLNWLGIEAENAGKPMIQSERLEIYKREAFGLVKAGKAYICTCSKEKLARDQEAQIKAKRPARYEGHCRTSEYKIENLSTGEYVIRMRMPESGKIVVNDLIHGKIEFDAALLDDQIILKSDGFPTYHLASVVDDHLMGITDVVRSDEWLPSTPKHQILYQAFGWQAPNFAHLPMILGPDRSKLSKRHGATAVLEYRQAGYLPEAVINFLAFLGWNPKDEREFFTLEELIREFDLKNINLSSAIFDQQKLDFYNEHYLRQLDPNELKKRLDIFADDIFSLLEIELIQRGGYPNLEIAAKYLKQLRREPNYDSGLLIFKKSDREKTIKGLKGAKDKISHFALRATGDRQDTNKWETDNFQKILESVVSEGGLSNGDVFWPIRVALSGEERSPSPVELAVVLGKKETIERIDQAIEKLG